MEKNNSTTILHLSDLHFGEGSVEDVDWKNYIELAERETRQNRLEKFIKALPSVPHFVIISGDICIGGREDGFKKFSKFFKDLIHSKKLPGRNNIIIVPGNHDVNRNYSKEDLKTRFDLFHKYIGKDYIRPWLKYHDNKDIINELKKRLNSPDVCPEVLGGIRQDEDTPDTVYSLPFKLDLNRGVFIYAFNSAAISGSRIEISKDVKEAINFLKTRNDSNQAEIDKVLNCLDEQLQIDPARIEAEERDIFYNITDRKSVV